MHEHEEPGLIQDGLQPMDVDNEDDEAEPRDADLFVQEQDGRPTISGREAITRSLRQKVYIERYPDEKAGAPAGNAPAAVDNLLGQRLTSPYLPFASEMDWKVARWAKLRGQGSTAMTEMLSIPGVSICPFVHVETLLTNL